MVMAVVATPRTWLGEEYKMPSLSSQKAMAGGNWGPVFPGIFQIDHTEFWKISFEMFLGSDLDFDYEFLD